MAPSSKVSSTPSKKKKTGRGVTKGHALNRLRKGEKFSVLVRNGQPAGKHTSKLAIWCGILRDGMKLRIDCLTWRVVDKAAKAHVWECVKEKFDVSEGLRYFIMQSVGKKWRDFKCELKSKNYDPSITDMKHYTIPPDGVASAQWHALVQY